MGTGEQASAWGDLWTFVALLWTFEKTLMFEGEFGEGYVHVHTRVESLW